MPRVVVVGDLIFDMLAKTEGPLALGVDTFAPIRTSAGGSGANAAAWLAREGVETHFVGRVGDDVFGELLEGEMRKAGAEAHLSRDPSLPTGKVFVLVDGAGERTMITDRGAGENLSPEELPQELFSHGHLHLSGYTLSGYTLSGDPRRATAFRALDLARRSGMTVSVDPSSAPLLESVGPDRFLEWTDGADLVFPNLAEGRILTGERSPDAVLETLLSHYGAAALKLGPEGAAYRKPGEEPSHVAATSAGAVDTTGAGDAFAAGFLAAWLAGRPPREALQHGTDLAARAVGKIGARP